MTILILRRFRSEIRDREDIRPNGHVVLTDDPKRAANVLATKLLLEEAFHGRIVLSFGKNGLICGSREEAGSQRLQQYTQNNNQEPDMLLSSLTVSEIETYLNEKTGDTHRVFVPDTAEVRFIERLAKDFEDVRYGI